MRVTMLQPNLYAAGALESARSQHDVILDAADARLQKSDQGMAYRGEQNAWCLEKMGLCYDVDIIYVGIAEL